MKKEDEILLKINEIEATINDIYKEIIKIKVKNEEKQLEQIHIMTKIENISDFIETRYNTKI